MDERLFSLIVLVAQSSAMVLLLRYSRVRPTVPRYLNSTAVVMAEVLKAVACFILVHTIKFKERSGWSAIRHDCSNSKLLAKLILPAFLYTAQNNLLFLALSNLTSVVYQITYQCKILTTAVFSILLLKKRITLLQWASLICLMWGVCLIQVQDKGSVHNAVSNRAVGFIAVQLASVISGFSGVYFEKMLKREDSSIWMQNFFLACYSIAFGLMNCLLNDGKEVRRNGFFQGYSALVWMVVCLQAFGGLLIAVVIKYADNIAKAFAASLSIILSSVLSHFLFNDFVFTWSLAVGATLVIFATIIYGYQEARQSSISTQMNTGSDKIGENRLTVEQFSLNDVRNCMDRIRFGLRRGGLISPDQKL